MGLEENNTSIVIETLAGFKVVVSSSTETLSSVEEAIDRLIKKYHPNSKPIDWKDKFYLGG